MYASTALGIPLSLHFPSFTHRHKIKKLQELVISSCLLAGVDCDCFFFSPQSSIKLQPDWKLKMLFWPQNKSLWISFTQPVYLSCDSAEMGLWIWILSGSKALAQVAEPCPWQPCWINSFQMAGLKNEKKSVEYKLILIWCYLRHRFNF